MKAVAYLRVSGKGQIDGDGFTRQLESIRSFAASRTIEVERVFQEEGVTGKSDEHDRPAFAEMVELLLSNGTRTVLIESMDRLARELRIQEQLIVYLASKGIDLISCNTGENISEAVRSDPMRKAMVQIQGVFAELDRSLLVRKLAKARQRQRESTGKCEGQKAFGDKPGESEILNRILGLSATIGAAEIADILNRESVKTRTGAAWSRTVVNRIIKRQSKGQATA